MSKQELFNFIKDHLSFEVSFTQDEVFWYINEYSGDIDTTSFFNTIERYTREELYSLLIDYLIFIK